MVCRGECRAPLLDRSYAQRHSKAGSGFTHTVDHFTVLLFLLLPPLSLSCCSYCCHPCHCPPAPTAAIHNLSGAAIGAIVPRSAHCPCRQLLAQYEACACSCTAALDVSDPQHSLPNIRLHSISTGSQGPPLPPAPSPHPHPHAPVAVCRPPCQSQARAQLGGRPWPRCC
jgi:hypothetical protein